MIEHVRRHATREGKSAIAGALALLCIALLVAAPPVRAQSVHEVTIAAPDIIAVEVRDAPFTLGRIMPLDRPSRDEPGTWIQVGETWGRVIGPDRKHVRLSDAPPAAYLDHARIDQAGAYPEIGGSKVKAVFRKSVPYDSGIYRGAHGETMTGASLRHYIYLQLSQPLAEGRHTIRWPAGALPDTPFDYASDRTRAIAVHANQNGYRATDAGKIAYLSLWLPGGPAEGAVDFRSYGLEAFHIIDEGGNRHFSSKIALRKAPTDPEPGNGLQAPLLEYPSASAPPVRITRIESGPPVRVGAPDHGFAKGQRIWLDGFSDPEKQYNGFATIAATTRDTFELTDLPSGNAAPASVGPPVARPVHQANRAGTFVFALDFSAWTPKANGRFRIHVPGLGVSDPFEIRDDVWLRAGRTSVGGLYNHRSGIPLDGRFGFTRPTSFRPGPQMTVYLSRLPLPWTSNAPYTGFITADVGGQPPWIKDEVAPDTYWGGYMDAGDWDRRIDHIDVSFLLLDVYESAPDLWRATPLGVPKSSELLDRDLYAGTDGLPDILHEAIWTLEFFRRLQLPDGSVRGGIESVSHPLLGEPSYLEHLTVFAYAPDHLSSYRYAGGAARLAGVLERAGQPRLAEVFRTSALAAWRAAERINADPNAHFAEARALAETSGALAGTPWEVQSKRLYQAATDQRIAAAGSLFRLAGEDEHRTIFETAWARNRTLDGHAADGAWDYLHARHPSANRELQDRIARLFVKSARSIAAAQHAAAYPNMKHPFAPLGWGQGLAPDYNQAQMFIRAHQINKDPDLLRTMQVASAQILGANQVGLSFTTGLGYRTIRHPLHEDHRAMGVKVPDGITIFGWAPQSQTAHAWIFGPYWSPLPISGTQEHAADRRIAPNRFTMPLHDYLIEHPLLVMQQEYTVHQSIGTTAGLWLYLHASAATGAPAGK
jgi:endoglucanase